MSDTAETQAAPTAEQPPARKRRGFAAMTTAKRREIASMGGKAAHEKGVAHRWDSAAAQAAGRKGGRASHQRGTAHRFTQEEAREAGRLGGRTPRGEGAEALAEGPA